MPELPEVETVVRQVRPQLVGRTIVAARVFGRDVLARGTPRGFCEALRGRRITAVRRRAKYFVLDLDDGRLLVGHLRMTGRLYVAREPDPLRTRARFDLDDGRLLLFTDVRKFGRLQLARSLDEALPPLGPEPLEALDGEWLAGALAARRRRLKPLLLDQSFVAGLGNIYVDESLHRAGLHPLRASDAVPRERAHALAAAIRSVLSAAIAAEGSSFDTFYRTPEGRPGAFQDEFAVYGRDGQPCRACGTSIRRIVVGQRGTHFCPRCQPAPRRGRHMRRGA
jgi:formamidopyrimidine-DNA glycosylase